MEDMSLPPAPASRSPTAKERKYDRQLRLWAAQGQAALEASHVLLINSGSGVTGIEALKNLVLPGIGSFTVCDPAYVTDADLGCNFFLDREDLGRTRATGCVRWLREMNHEVKGYANTLPIENFLDEPAPGGGSPLSPYTLIIVALPTDRSCLEKISEEARKLQIPVFFTHSVGFYSHFSLQLPSFFSVVDTHPDPSSTMDVRILEPWPELRAFVQEKTRTIESLDDEQHSHLPWIVILIYCMEKWREAHAGQFPSTYRQKNEFKAFVQSHARTGLPEGSEENFDEAVAAVLKSVNPHAPSSDLKALLASPEIQNLGPQSSSFQIIAHAIGRFYHKNHALPLPGAVPDMKAMSDDYVQLQNVFKAKARADVNTVLELVRNTEASLGRTDPRAQISEADVAMFCKSAASVKVVYGRQSQLATPHQTYGDRAKATAGALTMEDKLLPIHFAFLAWDRYWYTHVLDGLPVGGEMFEAPESLDIMTEKICGIAHTYMDALIDEAGTRVEDPEYSRLREATSQICQEIIRAEGNEMHTIAALTGGMIAQEAIKVLTHQYAPVDNTCLYDGIQSRTSVLRL